MEVTKKAEYAISALVELAAHPDGYISSKEIANRQNIPPNFLPQIMATLRTKGWVEGVRGPGGGVRLIVNPRDVSIKEVVELIEGPVAITRCLLREGYCENRDNCPLHEVWEEAQKAMLEVLEERTLWDVATSQKGAATRAGLADG